MERLFCYRVDEAEDGRVQRLPLKTPDSIKRGGMGRARAERGKA